MAFTITTAVSTLPPMDRENDLLRQEYALRWSPLAGALLPLVQAGRELSEPFLTDLAAHSYSEAPVRVAYVGQQTNGWLGTFGAKGLAAAPYIDLLQHEYRQFALGAQYKRTRFWTAGHKLYYRLNPNGPSNGFLWTNLLKVDEKCQCPQNDVRLLLARYFPVLERELELARPHVVVFVTGKDYDDILSAQLRGAILEPIGGTELNALARVRHEVLPLHSYRTFHPQASQWDPKKGRYMDDIIKLVENP